MIGIISAFGASISWTYACSIWRIQTILYKPVEINLLKNIFAFIIFSPTIILINYATEYKYFILLIISGIIGIGLGDSFYLKSLKLIGTRKTLSIEALSPLIATITGELLIDENLPINSWIGIVIVTITLITIIRKKSLLIGKDSQLEATEISFKKFIYAFLSVFCSVIAALLSRIVLLESNLVPIETTEIRLLGGIIFLLPITNFKFNYFIKNSNKKEKIRFMISILTGTNIGILLQQIVFKTLPLGIGWTLLSTSPIISLFFTRKEEGVITKEIFLLTVLLFVGLSLILL